MRGGDLHQAVLNKRLSELQILRIIVRSAAGLAYADDRKIIHRDVNPATYFWTGAIVHD